MDDRSKIKTAILSTFPPRQCGIGTFAKSLFNNLSNLYLAEPPAVLAINDERGLYGYPPEVIWQVDQFNEKAYVRAAEFVNQSGIEVISLQHEYGIFGGEDGSFILRFLEAVNKPVVTSLHSVLAEHSEHRSKLTQRILDLSDSVVIMTSGAKKVLLETFVVDPRKLKIIAHGVPNVRLDSKEAAKLSLGLENRIVLATFGLLNRGKGIEFVLDALPEVVKKYSNILYLIIGTTHPDILKLEGESYRQNLTKLIERLSLGDQVQFINRFLDYPDLITYLRAVDIYLSPQLDLAQSFSGTVSYAMGCGSAVISSPTNYAREVLAGKRGVIVGAKPPLIAKEILKLIDSKNSLKKMQLRSYQFARTHIWPQVALEALHVLESNLFIKKEKWQQRLPNFADPPPLDFLYRFSTPIGVLSQTRTSGDEVSYNLDDQAMALLACLLCREYFSRRGRINRLMEAHLHFLRRVIGEDGVINQGLNGEEGRVSRVASGEMISRSFWALAAFLARSNVSLRERELVQGTLNIYRTRIRNTLVRPIAFNLLAFAALSDQGEVGRLADSLVERFEQNSDNSWQWFEDDLTWGSAFIPYALASAHQVDGNDRYLETALAATHFLERISRYKGIPAPVGQDGWYRRSYRRAFFDQLSTEPAGMVILYNKLFALTGEEKYREKALEWHGWYFGNNILEAIIYDNITRGVFDRLTRRGPDKSQSAAASIAYILSYCSFGKNNRSR